MSSLRCDSRLTNSTRLTLWDPRSVLRIDDDCRCVGQAYSKGRKCLYRIAGHNVSKANSILRSLSQQQPDAERLIEELDRLAESLLCVRFHRDQVEEIVDKWMDRMEEVFPGGVAPVPTPSRRLQALMEFAASTSSHRNATTASSPTVTRLESEPPSPRTASSPVPLPARSEREALQETIAAMQETLRVAQHRLTELQHRVPAARTSPPASPSRVSTSDISSLDLSRRSTAQLAATNAPATLSQSANHARPCTQTHVRRRTVDDECPVCMREMSMGGALPLVWCRSQCGKSVHAECWEAWRAEQERGAGRATCVYCRADWAPDCECED